jgi:transcriptional regulator of nitric oxide reductase
LTAHKMQQPEQINDGDVRTTEVGGIPAVINDAGATVGQEAIAARVAPASAARGTTKVATPDAARRVPPGTTRAATIGEVTDAVRGATAGQAAGMAVSASNTTRAIDTTSPWASVPWSGTLPHPFLGRSLVTGAQQSLTPFSCFTREAGARVGTSRERALPKGA